MRNCEVKYKYIVKRRRPRRGLRIPKKYVMSWLKGGFIGNGAAEIKRTKNKTKQDKTTKLRSEE